jgi:RimJ/RimL family protein N-acetyltransferase
MIAGHDDEARRWLGRADVEPKPAACIVVAGDIAGWVDYDAERDWLEPGEVNIGYGVFAAHRGRGYATRAVQLLMHHLALRTDLTTGTLLIDRANERSLAVARRLSFDRCGTMGESDYFKRPVPPRAYTDGVVVLRSVGTRDLQRHLDAVDDEQIDWLWEPGHREQWEAKTTAEKRAHQLGYLRSCEQTYGTGPKWHFAVDAPDADYAVYVDCDLANAHVPAGEANISYTAHTAYRGKGYVSRAVRLVMLFLRDNTGAREAHIVVDEDNVKSLRLAHAVGARERERFVNEHGRTMVRHVVDVRSS